MPLAGDRESHPCDSASLAEKVQSLTPELFDVIKSLTFAILYEEKLMGKAYEDEYAILIDHNYKPSKLLQIDRQTRRQFAQDFYGGGRHFMIPRPLFVPWIRSIAPEHLRLIPEIYCDIDPEPRKRSWAVEKSRKKLRKLFAELEQAGVDIACVEKRTLINYMKMETFDRSSAIGWTTLWRVTQEDECGIHRPNM